MKKRDFLFSLLTIPLLLTGCIYDDLKGCSGTIYYEFLYEGNTALFDKHIANDLYFHQYHMDTVKTMTVIPFEQIRGGRYFSLPKKQTGKKKVVVWTVPATAPDTGKIPREKVGERKEDLKIELEPVSGRSNSLHKPLGFLHRGIESWEETDLLKNEYRSITITPAVCCLTVILHDDGNFPPEKTPGIEVHGLQKELNINLEPSGEDVTIEGGEQLTYDSNRWNSRSVYLPPSRKGKTLSVKITSPSHAPFMIHTQHEPKAGDFILIEIKESMSIVLHINGWRYEEFRIENL